MLKDKCILVTGGSRGIGRAIVEAFANAGGRIAFTYKENESAAEDVLRSLPGKHHLTICYDALNSQSSQEVIQTTVDNLGGLDILVNNAGIYIPHEIRDVSLEKWQDAWRKTISVNLFGPADLSFCAAKHMMQHGGGRIVAISSRGAFRGEPKHPAYAASKAGLNALSQSLAQALAPFGIFVGIVAPGFVETDMTVRLLDGIEGEAIRAQSPLNRVAKPEEVASAVLFLASEGNEFTTGTIIDVNGASYLRS